MENNQVAPEGALHDGAENSLREQPRRRHQPPSDIQKRSDATGSPSLDGDDERVPLLSGQTAGIASAESSPGRDYHRPWSSDFEGLPWHRRPSIYWLLPAFLPFCLAFGGLIVPRVNLILSLVCHDYFSEKAVQDPTFTFLPVMIGADNPQCQIPEVQARVAKFQMYITLCAGIFSALVTPYLGALSDRIGRKKVITIAACGLFMNEIVTIIVGTNSETVSIYWLLLGSACDGLAGSFTTSSAVCYSYAADCTAPERRNVAFGYFHGTLFTGMALGPILAGYLVKWAGDIMIIFYVALGCHVFFIVFLNAFVPESLSKDRQLRAREKHRALMLDPAHNTWRAILSNYNFFAPLSILWPTGQGSSPVIRRNMIFLATIDVLCFGVAMGTMGIIIIYAEYVFGWSNLESSEFLSAANISRVLSLLIFLPGVTRLVRGPLSSQRHTVHEGADKLDLNIIRVGIFFDLLGYVGYASALSGGVMVASGMIAAFGGMASPTLQAALTKHVPADRTGQLLGATGLLHALARVVSPIVFNLIYAKTVGTFTPAVFVCLASVFLVAEFLSWFLKPGLSLPPDYQDPHVAHEDRDRRYFIHRVSSAAFDGIRRRVSTGGWSNGTGWRERQTVEDEIIA